jgi:hypothetical protein
LWIIREVFIPQVHLGWIAFHLFLDEKVEPKINHDPSAGPRTHKACPLSALARAARIVDTHRTRRLNRRR